jgi:hypothetical protein
VREPAAGAPSGRTRSPHGAADGLERDQECRLLGLAQREFDVFLTLDQHLSEQQHLPQFEIAVVVLAARSNALHDLLELLEPLLAVLPTAPKRAARRIPE